MSSAFDRAMVWILRAEGGYVDDPDDPGGRTKYGISQRAYPDVDIASLEPVDARAIYHRNYWIPCRCDDLPYSVALVVFDSAVLMGTGKAGELLQRGLRGLHVDGIIGPRTIQAAQDRGVQRINFVLTERLLFLTRLPTWSRFGEGWTIRILNLLREVRDEL